MINKINRHAISVSAVSQSVYRPIGTVTSSAFDEQTADLESGDHAELLTEMSWRLKKRDRRMYHTTINRLLTDRNDCLSAILVDIDEFLSGADYDEEFMRPEEEASVRLRQLLRDSNAFVTGYFPSGAAYPDGDGGLGVEWAEGSKKMVLSLPALDAQRSSSLYYRWNGDAFGTIFDITPEILSKHINYFNGNE